MGIKLHVPNCVKYEDTMPDNREILRIGQIVLREIDHFGHDAEFIAYVGVAPQDGT